MEKVFLFKNNIVDENHLETRFFKDAIFLKQIVDNYELTCKTCHNELSDSFSHNDSVSLANTLHKLIGSTLIFINDKDIILNLRELEASIREQGLKSIDEGKISEIKLFTLELITRLNQVAQKWRFKRNLECVSNNY